MSIEKLASKKVPWTCSGRGFSW